MDPLSFVILQRITSKAADWIDKLFDLYDHLTFSPTRKEREEFWQRPGAPGYLPRKSKSSN